MLEHIGGGWYANQKQPKRNKIENLSNIEKGVDGKRAHAKRWWSDWMFQTNWVSLECVVP